MLTTLTRVSRNSASCVKDVRIIAFSYKLNISRIDHDLLLMKSVRDDQKALYLGNGYHLLNHAHFAVPTQHDSHVPRVQFTESRNISLGQVVLVIRTRRACRSRILCSAGPRRNRKKACEKYSIDDLHKEILAEQCIMPHESVGISPWLILWILDEIRASERALSR